MNRKSQVGNRICAKKQNDEAYTRHLTKLKEIKLNNSRITEIQIANERLIAASNSLHLNNKKKDIMNELYYIEVERENRILLEKMSKIMRPSNKTLISMLAFFDNKWSYVIYLKENRNSAEVSPEHERETKSLNKGLRKRELLKISNENQELMKRLQEKKSIYNTQKLGKDYRLYEQYLHNISEYPINRLNNSQIINSSFLNADLNKDDSVCYNLFYII